MIVPEKTYTDNPFVDNVIYYAKLMAMNSVVKDEDEALANETAESLAAGELLIACVEGFATYGMFTYVPKAILEKYIKSQSNLDLYAGDNNSLQNHLNSLSKIERTRLFNNLSSLARIVYIDHYDIMTNYLNGLPETWMSDYKPLYDSCVAGTATYADLFEEMPYYTRYRVIKCYLNNYDSRDLDTICESLENFQAYIDERSDTAIEEELENITKAMTAIFISHYDMMIERGYVTESASNWFNFICLDKVFDACKNGTATYADLYDLFPDDALEYSLTSVLGEDTCNKYDLTAGLDALETYFENYSTDPDQEEADLTELMSSLYLRQYNPLLNFDTYQKCIDEEYDYWDLTDCIPYETLKIIINAYIDEVTNLEVYQNSKAMLDSYLATLDPAERKRIQDGITKDMIAWYPDHHVETNNYYRAFLGLPPMDENGNIYEDTLEHSYDADTNSYFEFGNRFLSMVPKTSYPDIHWKQEFYTYDSYDINILESEGIIDAYVEACGSTLSSPRYRYLKFLGDNKLDCYTCRRAMNFQLIGVPTIDDTEAKNAYIDTFGINRDYVIRAVYSDAYKFQSDYYNKFMIIFIIINTIMDMLTDIPSYIIHRVVFDSRCVKYIFESYGIPYYSEIPLKYQRAMLKNLNILIKYKSSTKNMIDICNLFGFSDVRVFGYYLFRERNVDTNTGEYIFDDYSECNYDLDDLYVMDENGEIIDWQGIRFSRLSEYRNYWEDEYTHVIYVENDDGSVTEKRVINQDADVYVWDKENNDFIPLKDVDYFTKIKANTDEATLKFVKVPIDESFIDYKNDPDYIINYDEIVYQDEGDTWDGGLVHENLYNDLLNYEFNAVRTKYISVETVTSMSELAFQVSYFYNMLFDNMYSEDELTVYIPHIQIGHAFRFMDIICYLFALMYLYNDLEDNIMYSPSQILYVKGYYWDDAAEVALNDPTCFQQTDPLTGEELPGYEKYNIFDINERIAEDNYNYQAAFMPYWIRSFNLQADVDELEKWLNEEYHMSLDDFIVDDSLTTFSQIITLRSFFSLNNSYYQKSIFEDHVYPLQYNQYIKYAYGYEIYTIEIEYDLDGNKHRYVLETDSDGNRYFMEVIDDSNDQIYIMDYEKYIIIGSYAAYHAVYQRYTRTDDGDYVQDDYMFYYRPSDGEYTPLFTGEIGIIDSNKWYIFAADTYYTKNEDGEYEEVTEDRFFSQDPYDENKKILNFGQYYILVNGEYIIDPDNCYVVIVRNGEKYYVLASTLDNYTNIIVAEEDCYVLHSDGHFIKLTDTDYYKKKENGDDTSTEYEYTEEDCYIITDEVTEYYDPTADPIVYYKKLSDYYSENNWVIYGDNYYVKDADGNYIPVEDLLNPANCWYYGEYGFDLVINAMGDYEYYDNPKNIGYVLVLQETNDYSRLKYDQPNLTYVLTPDEVNWYVLNSDEDYVTVLLTDKTYAETNLMIVVFNKFVTDPTDLNEGGKYDPEKTDNVWDENDWFYYLESYDPDNALLMNGENKWYYRKGNLTPNDDEDTLPVGSGFYMEATSYLGDVTLEEGERYYMAFDVETNFTGTMQIYCTADSSVEGISDRVYEVSTGEKFHVSQIFVANEIAEPEIRWLIYDYDKYPIHIGDYVVVSDIRFVKAYNENFIAQDIPSYDKLQELYRTNEAIYNYLVDLMVNCSDYYEYRIYKRIYDSLMLSKYNKEAFKTGENTYAKTYTDFLASRDAVLYERLIYYKTLDTDTMHKEVADDIVEVTYAIDDCVDTYSYGYLYSYFPAVSASYIQQYITKIINFFKSWKVQMLGINTVYKFDDPNENTIKILEGQQYRGRTDEYKCNIHIADTVKVNPLDSTNISGEAYSDLYPDLVQYTQTLKNYVRVHDRVRVISKVGNKIAFSDNFENIHLIFNDDEIKVNVEDENNLLISSNEDSFSVANLNEMVMTTDESDDEAFSAQILNEINLFSTDIIEWRDIENEPED